MVFIDYSILILSFTQFIDDDAKLKRKRKTHRKRDGSPKPKPRSPEEDEEDFERPPKTVGDWEDPSDLDFERQLELERRRQDLQRQLALMDEEDAAASAEETEWKGKEDEKRKVPIIHSKLHPDPSPSTTGGETPTQTVKKKKKKKLDSEGKKTKVKKEASPRIKQDTKRKVSSSIDEEEISKKEEAIGKIKVKKTAGEYVGSSDDADLSEHQPVERATRKVSRHIVQARSMERNDSPTRSRPDERKRPEDDQIRHKREQTTPIKDRRKVELSSDEQRDESHLRRPRNTSQDYYPADEQDDENRKVRPRVSGGKRHSEGKHVEDVLSEERGRRREVEDRMSSRGPRTPSPPPHPKDDRYYYDEQQEKKLPRGPPRSPPREPTREESVYRKDSRGRPEDPHVRGPQTPSDDEARFSPSLAQGEGRVTRYAERDKPPPRRENRERVPISDQVDQRYPDKGGRIDSDFEKRKPREEEFRGRRPPDYPRTKDDEHPKHRGRDDNYPRNTQDEEFARHRDQREEIKGDYQKGKYRDERAEVFPARPRGREDVEFTRGRGRGERDDEGRVPLPQRDVHRRMHDHPEGHERDARDERGRPRPDYTDR